MLHPSYTDLMNIANSEVEQGEERYAQQEDCHQECFLHYFNLYICVC